MIKGVLFDMDGVLVDSEQFICKAAIMMFEEMGQKVTERDFLPFVGTGENRYIGGVAEKYGINLDIEKAKARTYSIYSEIVKGKLDPLPGASEFIDRCRNRDLVLALATSADHIKVMVNLHETKLDPGLFCAIITGQDVIRRKPSPDIYLRAAADIGLKTSECLVVEDAVSGVRAGKAAGCRCLAITSTFRPDELSDADWIYDSLITVPDEVINW